MRKSLLLYLTLLYLPQLTSARENNRTYSQDEVRTVEAMDKDYSIVPAQYAQLRARIPFENKMGSIILRVKINGFDRPLRLLFDTGADGMAISQSLADEIGLKVTRQNNASVVGGNVNIQVSDGNTVTLDTLVLHQQGIAIFPQIRKQTDGIIGNSLTKHFIVEIDYDNNEMLLYDFGDHQLDKKAISVPFKMPTGLLILPGDLTIKNTHTGNFVFDTGAAYSLICFRPFVRDNKLLVSGFKPEYMGSTSSLGMVSPTYTGRSDKFNLPHLSPLVHMPVTLMAGNGANEQWNPGFDGSIGTRLISRYNFTINLQKKEISFKPNKSHSFPQDFNLGNYLLGFDNMGDLRMINSVGIAADKATTIPNGTKVTQINGYDTKKLRNNDQSIAALQALAKGSTLTLHYIDDQGVNRSIAVNR